MSLVADETTSPVRSPPRSRPRSGTWRSSSGRRLEEAGLLQLLEEIEQPLIRVLAAMERIGLKLDRDKVAEMTSGLEERILELETEIHGQAGREFTIGSPQQVGQVLFEELGLTRKRRGKTGFSTDARVLAQIRDEHEIVALIEEWRELTKLKNTYLDPLPTAIDPATGRVHTTFIQTAAPTGRISSDPAEPAEHPDPLRSRPAAPGLFRRRARQPAGFARLQPGGAAGAGPCGRRRGAQGLLPGRRGRSLAQPRPRSSRSIPPRSTRPSVPRRRWSTSESSTA